MLTTLLVLALLALLVPARAAAVRASRLLGLVALLGLVLWVVPRLVGSFRELHTPLRAVLDGREFRVASLGFEDRQELNHLAGRRRKIELDIKGFLYAPRSGEYELELSCDDRCSLSLDGHQILEVEGRSVARIELEEGAHALRLHYRQIRGPANLKLDWRRPGLWPLLPLPQFVFGQAEDWSPWTLTLKRLKLAAVGLGALATYTGLFLLWFTTAPALRRELGRVTRSWWAASLETARRPERMSRHDLVGFVSLFLAALVVRVVLLAAPDLPILYGHPYSYYNNALRILEHPHPWAFLLESDEWHLWQSWTVAPLYYVFLAGLFHFVGPELLTFRIVHGILDSVVAVSVTILGRRLAGPWGVLAGVVYALFWPAIELLNWTLTENLHTALLMVGTALLLRESDAPGRGRAFAAGLVLGLSAMTRAVSSAFFALVFFWRLFLGGVSLGEARRNWVFACFIGLGGSAIILPWTARNVFVIGEPVLIETVSFFNLFNDNEPRREMTAEVRRIGPGPARRAKAVDVALRGIRERPDYFASKVATNLWHFLRPDGLQGWLRVEHPEPGWLHAVQVLFGDVPLLAGVVLFFPWLLAGSPSPARRLTLSWIGYYLLMVVVVFHNELRYRIVFMPFLFAAAAGGILVLRSAGRRSASYAGLVLGLIVALVTLAPYGSAAYRRASSSMALRAVPELIEKGAIDEARRHVLRATEIAGRSPRPWILYGHWLAAERRAAEAVEAYEKAREIASVDWIPRVVLPQLLREAGENESELTEAIRSADWVSWSADSWLMLEIAWRELPPPRTDMIRVGWGDYGAARGFMEPRGDERAREIESRSPLFQKSEPGTTPPGFHRWTRDTAWLRLIPTYRSTEHWLVIEMGSPYPSILPNPKVEIRVNGGRAQSFMLDRMMHAYELAIETRPGEPIVIRIDAPVWSRAGEPASQGVRVDRVSIRDRRSGIGARS
jgi:hypothetical protein